MTARKRWTEPDRLDVLVRQLNAALRDLDQFDSADKGSRWLTHPDEGKRLGDRVRELDALIEAETDAR